MKYSTEQSASERRSPICVSVNAGYRLWSRSYDSDANPLLALEQRTLSDMLEGVAGRVFLDVACGTGRWMAEAAARGARCFGVDLNTGMLSAAQRKLPLDGRLARADALDLPFPDRCAGMAVCSFALGYIRPRARLISELGRTVERGGTVLVSDLHPHARRNGWRRSFRSGSEVFEIESDSWTIEELMNAGSASGLRLRKIVEPHFGHPEHLIMKKAGKASLIDEVSSVPAILAVVWARL